MTQAADWLIAQDPEHCHRCYRLIHPGEEYYETEDGTALCERCAADETAGAVLETISVAEDIFVEVRRNCLVVRRGDQAVVVPLSEVRHLIDALVDGAVKAVNSEIHGDLEVGDEGGRGRVQIGRTLSEEQIAALMEALRTLMQLGKHNELDRDDNGGNGHERL